MRRLTTISILAALFTTILVTSASATRTQTTLLLGATNTFTSGHSGYAEVTLDHEATWKWDVFDSKTLRVTGDGRAAGFLLVRQDSKKPQGIYGAFFRVCATAGCSNGWSSWLTRFVVPVGLKWPKKELTFTLPAGRYRAYVITDGAPVTATLMLDDIKGSLEVSATTPVKASVGMEAAPEPVKNVFTAGSSFKLASRGVGMIGFVERHGPGAIDLFNDCFYKGNPSLPKEIAFTPACEAAGAEMGTGEGFSLPPLVTSGGSGAYSIKPSLKPGSYSFGGSYVGAQSVRDAAFLSLWVSYD